MSLRFRAVLTLSALIVSGGLGACGSPPRPAAAPAAEPSVSAATADPAPPLGEYALTRETAMVIAQAESARTTGDPSWTLKIGDDDSHSLLPRPDGGWRVPALDLELEADERDGVRGVRVRRYGESVFVRPVGQDPLVEYDARKPTSRSLAELTPRLMIALNVPGVGIALIRNGEVAWRGYFGVKRAGAADRVDSATVFEAASMSKPAYTFPFMKLVEPGRIDLDTPLVRYLGGDYIPGDTLHRAITARMVLTHRAGLPNWRGDEGLTVLFPPGTQTGYSGEGFQFLQTVVEKVTGTPMAEFTREELFQPLGLSSASYVWRAAYDSTMATGHTTDGIPRPRRPYRDANAAYTLYITPADYARILIEIMRAAHSGSPYLGLATTAVMLEPHHLAPDREPIRRGGRAEGEVHYALGWRMDRTPTGDRYWHSGSNSTGFQCYAEFDPGTGDGIVIMTNSSSGSPLWRSLMNAIVRP